MFNVIKFPKMLGNTNNYLKITCSIYYFKIIVTILTNIQYTTGMPNKNQVSGKFRQFIIKIEANKWANTILKAKFNK